ncbi:TPA: T6SS effector BTH_I2691 family protein [Pseudomonas aeruginosa]
MSTSDALGTAANQAVPNATASCNACQRAGLPILPLRAAYAPAPQATQMLPVSRGSDLMVVNMRIDQPRTLREGYLYVLLDKAEWQAYQVTPEGALRQFRPYQPPREEPRSLSEDCIGKDHDVTASFINIDTDKYSTAWIAFSSDPWPKSVLDRYLAGTGEDGTSLEPRFHQLDLKAARENPASAGLAMTEHMLQVDQQVLEYATPTSGDFTSVHGFSTRNHRLEALRGFVRTQTARQQLPQGVLALVLPDPVGLVQEINHQRLSWQRQRQLYETDPERNYHHFTSECLKRLREMCKQAADDAVPVSTNIAWEIMPSESGGPPVFGDPAREREVLVARKTKQLLGRLDDRYSERKRAAFEKDFEATKKRLQQQIDDMAVLYASHMLTNPLFRLAERYDYDPRVPFSVVGYIQTFEACLRGGITEASPPPAEDGTVQPVSGPSADAWQGWIGDGQSIVFKTLLACDKSLMASLLPTFNNQGELDWNDFPRLYTAITKMIVSDDWGEQLIQPKVQTAIASVLAAYNGAVGRLSKKVSAGARNVATGVNSAAVLLYSHTHMTQVAIRMKVGEYYKLMCEQITHDRNRLLSELRELTGRANKQVRSVLMGGVLSMALSDPKLAEQTVEVILWVEGKASDLREQLGGSLKATTKRAGDALDTASRRVSEAVAELKVLAGTLEPNARQLLAGLQVRGGQLNTLVRSGLSGARSAAGIGRGVLGVELLVSVGGTYLLSNGLSKSMDSVDNTFGAKHDEAVLALYSASVGVLGGSIEAIGLVMRNGAKTAQDVLSLPQSGVGTVSKVVESGKVLARFGAILGAASGLIDAIASATAASRTSAAGDIKARNWYLGATAFYSISAGFAMYAAFSGSTAILSASWVLGPVGWAILLGLAGYMLWKFAEEEESSPLERWALYSHFGDANDKLKWPDANTAVAALNAAVMGVDGRVKFSSTVRAATYPSFASGMGGMSAGLMYQPLLEYQVVLPNYDASRAGFSWKLKVRRYLGTEILASGNHQLTVAPSKSRSKRRKRLDYDPETTKATVTERTITAADGNKTNFLIAEGTVDLKIGHDITEAKIEIEYLPNIDDPEMLARIELTDLK